MKQESEVAPHHATWTGRRRAIMGAAVAVLAAATMVTATGPALADAPVTVNIMLQGFGGSGPNGRALDLREGTVSYYAGGWQTITGVNSNNKSIAQAALTPGTYTFAVTYNGTRAQTAATITTNGQTVYFGAANVSVNLTNSAGQPLPVTDDTGSYYAGSWHGMPAAGVEMLPGTYSFAAVYNGTRQQKSYTVAAPNSNNNANVNQTVDFRTTLVNVALQAPRGYSGPVSIPNNGSASYYAGGWYPITQVNTNNGVWVQTQMLPGTYSFAATYNGTRSQKNSVTVGDSATVVWFAAALVDTSLTVNGLPVGANDVASSYYAGKWNTMPAAGSLMLPGSYAFAVVYNGVRQQQSYTVLEPNTNNGANGQQTVSFTR